MGAHRNLVYYNPKTRKGTTIILPKWYRLECDGCEHIAILEPSKMGIRHVDYPDIGVAGLANISKVISYCQLIEKNLPCIHTKGD